MIEFESNWYKNIKDGDKLILSDDIDSLLSCKYLEKKFGAKINLFYNFSELFTVSDNKGSKDKDNDNQVIGVDIDLIEYKCFSNHVVPIKNDLCVGFNQLIDWTKERYTQKFAGSTYLTLLYLYEDIDFWNSLSTEQIKVIMSIDSGYLQYYKYRKQFNYWYGKMGIDKIISKALDEIGFDEMERFTKQKEINSSQLLMLDGNIIWDGNIDIKYIERLTGLDLNIDNLINYQLVVQFQRCRGDKGNVNCHHKSSRYKVFSCARVYKDSYKYTILVK